MALMTMSDVALLALASLLLATMAAMMSGMSGMDHMSMDSLMDHMSMDHMSMDHLMDPSMMSAHSAMMASMSGMSGMESMSMDMGGMASMSMDMGGMASMSMDMGGNLSMGGMSGMGGMGGMDMGGELKHMMNMWFTAHYLDYPVVFHKLTANNGAQAFGIFVLLFFVAFFVKGMDFLRMWLEVRVWKNPVYLNSCGDVTASYEKPLWPVRIFRDCVRLFLCFVPEMFGYYLMLATMTYVLVYFFAVVTGMALGKFAFDKLSYFMGLQPAGATRC